MRVERLLTIIFLTLLISGCSHSEEKVLVNYRLGELEIFLDSVETSMELTDEMHWKKIEDRYHFTVAEINATSDSLSSETRAHLKDLELRLKRLKQQAHARIDNTEVAREEESESIIAKLEEIVEMNASTWETVSDSYQENLIWIEKNGNYLSEKTKARIDSLTKIIEDKRRSE